MRVAPGCCAVGWAPSSQVMRLLSAEYALLEESLVHHKYEAARAQRIKAELQNANVELEAALQKAVLNVDRLTTENAALRERAGQAAAEAQTQAAALHEVSGECDGLRQANTALRVSAVAVRQESARVEARTTELLEELQGLETMCAVESQKRVGVLCAEYRAMEKELV